jgi:hypothetical protein
MFRQTLFADALVLFIGLFLCHFSAENGGAVAAISCGENNL